MHGIHVGVVDNIAKVDLERVQAYLPSNYTASQVGSVIVVEGRDVAGWTYKDYVEPRLASGMIYLRDVTPKAPGGRNEVDVLGDIHSDIQNVMDKLDDLKLDKDAYPYTREEIEEAAFQLSFAHSGIGAAINSWKLEYDQLLERMEQ